MGLRDGASLSTSAARFRAKSPAFQWVRELKCGGREAPKLGLIAKVRDRCLTYLPTLDSRGG